MKLRERFWFCSECWHSASWTDPNTDRRLCERHLPAEPIGLNPKQREWLSGTITQINPIYNPALDIPGITMTPTVEKRRFDVLQCRWCLGVHSGACRRVHKLKFHPNGDPAAVTYWPDGSWDDSDVIWREQVFGITEDDGKPGSDSTGTDGGRSRPADVA